MVSLPFTENEQFYSFHEPAPHTIITHQSGKRPANSMAKRLSAGF
jgi:hypothetical protein